MWQQVRVDCKPVGEASDTVERGGDDPGVVVEGDDRQLGQEHRQQGVGLLLLAVRQRFSHGVPVYYNDSEDGDNGDCSLLPSV